MGKEQFEKFIERLRYWNEGEGVEEHITADPIFLVERKARDYGYDPDYSDNVVYIYDGETEYESLEEYYNSLDEDEQQELDDAVDSSIHKEDKFCDLSEFWQWELLSGEGGLEGAMTKTAYQDRWEYVCSHFTKEGAEAFIQRKKHDYPMGLRVFVDAQIHCNEYQQIIKALLDGTIVHKEQI